MMAHRINGKLRPQHAQRRRAPAARSVGDVSLEPPGVGRQAEHRPPSHQPARAAMPDDVFVHRGVLALLALVVAVVMVWLILGTAAAARACCCVRV